MGGKSNIEMLFFLGFWGEGFREMLGELGGEGHQKAKEGTKKHDFALIFDEKTLNYIIINFWLKKARLY